MERDAATESAVTSDERDAPVTEPGGKPVYGRDGLELGVAGPVVVDLETGRATALTVEGVDERRYPRLQTGSAGVRVPYDYVRGVSDAVVLDVTLARFRGNADAGVSGPEVDSTADAPARPQGSRAERREDERPGAEAPPPEGAPRREADSASESDHRLIE
jgi:sporulation protein YlmC with PRC-barrel domain